MHKLKNKKGFTLVELLIAITVLAILAGIIFLLIMNARKDAGKARGLQFSSQMYRAMSTYCAMEMKFEDLAGGIYPDFSGNNYTCVRQSGHQTLVSDVPTGDFIQSLKFYGDGGLRCGVGLPGPLLCRDMTLEFWIKPDYPFAGGIVFDKGNEFKIYFNIYTGQNCFTFASEGPSGHFETWYDLKHGMNGSEWHHFAFTRRMGDGTGTVYMYKDGALAASSDGENASVLMTGRTCDPGTTTPVSLNIDCGRVCGAGGFKGLLDNVRVYTEPITAFEIRKHYAEGLFAHQNPAE